MEKVPVPVLEQCTSEEVSVTINSAVRCECEQLSSEINSLDLYSLLESGSFDKIRQYYRLAGYVSVKDSEDSGGSYTIIFSRIGDNLGVLYESTGMTADMLKNMHTRFRVKSLLNNPSSHKDLKTDYTFNHTYLIPSDDSQNQEYLISLGVKSYECYETTRYDENGSVDNDKPNIPFLQKSILLFVSKEEYLLLLDLLDKGARENIDLDLAKEMATRDTLEEPELLKNENEVTKDPEAAPIVEESEVLKPGEFTVADVWAKVREWRDQNVESGYMDKNINFSAFQVDKLISKHVSPFRFSEVDAVMSRISYDVNEEGGG